jgi:hypothetical protein
LNGAQTKKEHAFKREERHSSSSSARDQQVQLKSHSGCQSVRLCSRIIFFLHVGDFGSTARGLVPLVLLIARNAQRMQITIRVSDLPIKMTRPRHLPLCEYDSCANCMVNRHTFTWERRFFLSGKRYIPPGRLTFFAGACIRRRVQLMASFPSDCGT